MLLHSLSLPHDLELQRGKAKNLRKIDSIYIYIYNKMILQCSLLKLCGLEKYAFSND